MTSTLIKLREEIGQLKKKYGVQFRGIPLAWDGWDKDMASLADRLLKAAEWISEAEHNLGSCYLWVGVDAKLLGGETCPGCEAKRILSELAGEE